MIYDISSVPKDIQTTITLPSSKSISNRALIIRALSRGGHFPENLSDCDDTQVMIRALEQDQELIDIRAAGTAMRFLTAYYSATPGTHILTGTERMRQRPIHILVEALRELGADIQYMEEEGFPPLRITGKQLSGGEISLQGSVSSQYISALLMIAPMLERGLTIRLTGEIISLPYIQLTLQLMKTFKAVFSWEEGSRVIHIEPHRYESVPFFVESDWSGASYWYEIAALSEQANIVLPHLYDNSHQGDSRGAQLFELLGVHTLYEQDKVTLLKTQPQVNRLTHNFVEMPDLAQTFVVTCLLLNVPFRFSGLQSLKIKETDRIAALITECKKLGYLLQEEDASVLCWNGERCEAEHSPLIHTYEDHRMAMAFAPAALKVSNLRIADPQVVSKSYPNFWEDLQKAGFHFIKES